MGDQTAAKTAFEKWIASEKDDISDCKACTQGVYLLACSFMGAHRQALESMQPILDGSRTCDQVPSHYYPDILHSLIQTGQKEEAHKIFAIALQTLETARNPYKFCDAFLKLILCSISLGEKARQIFQQHRENLRRNIVNNDLERCYFLLLLELLETQHEGANQERTQQFDQRNGNTYYSQLRTRMLNLA